MAIELPELPDLTPGEAPPPPAPAASGAPSLLQTVLATLVVTVMAGAMGALFAVPPPAPPPEPAAKAEPTPGGVVPAASGLFEMPPIVTNIGSPKDTWIRLEASIVFDAKTVEHPEALAEDIAGDELAYLRTVSLAQVEGPIGLENIRQDLNERAAIRSGGKVSELVIRTLVVQ
jgi:flagellar FliL protein